MLLIFCFDFFFNSTGMFLGVCWIGALPGFAADVHKL